MTHQQCMMGADRVNVCAAVQVDADGDRLVSHSEFMELVKRDDFSENEEWEVRGHPR